MELLAFSSRSRHIVVNITFSLVTKFLLLGFDENGHDMLDGLEAGLKPLNMVLLKRTAL